MSQSQLDLLPPEILGEISAQAIDNGDGISLSSVSRTFHRLCLPCLYRDISVPSRISLSSLVRTLRKRPGYAVYTQSLSLFSVRINWNEAIQLARVLATSQAPVTHLRVRFSAEDVSQAIDFFQNFSPRHFEWVGPLLSALCSLLSPWGHADAAS